MEVPQNLQAARQVSGRFFWQFTIQYLDDGETWCTWGRAFNLNQPEYSCICCKWQHEIGEGGRDHIQGIAWFAKQTRWQLLDHAFGYGPDDGEKRHYHTVNNRAHARYLFETYCGEDKPDGTRHGCETKSFGQPPAEPKRGRGGRFGDTGMPSRRLCFTSSNRACHLLVSFGD